MSLLLCGILLIAGSGLPGLFLGTKARSGEQLAGALLLFPPLQETAGVSGFFLNAIGLAAIATVFLLRGPPRATRWLTRTKAEG